METSAAASVLGRTGTVRMFVAAVVARQRAYLTLSIRWLNLIANHRLAKPMYAPQQEVRCEEGVLTCFETVGLLTTVSLGSPESARRQPPRSYIAMIGAMESGRLLTQTFAVWTFGQQRSPPLVTSSGSSTTRDTTSMPHIAITRMTRLFPLKPKFF